MIVHSFYLKHGQMKKLEVEVKLLPGLPQLQVVGLPDTSLKESSLRIKSALTSQGFSWPRAKQVVVNLRPNHIRKKSQGLELAIACAILWETGQIPPLETDSRVCVYGELSLDGGVLASENLESIRPALRSSDLVICSANGTLYHSLRVNLCELKDLLQPNIETVNRDFDEFESVPTPPLPEIYFSSAQARLLKVAALSKASTLLAGPPGSGKTTFAESLAHLMPDLTSEEFFQLRAHHLQFGVKLNGRPVISPHHSTPAISLIGGGSELFPGELAKAHGGLFILDEFLLFPSRVIEALREPLVSKIFRVSRRGISVEWAADFQFVATTNLCPCGKLIPERNLHCSYSLTRCRSVVERLSGPMLDRFELVILMKSYGRDGAEETVSLREIKAEVDEARKLEGECIEEGEIPEVLCVFESRRRVTALKKLAKTLALIDGELKIQNAHWMEAFELSQKPLHLIQSLFK